MKTSYGLEFNTVTKINPQWSGYDRTVAECHLANAGVIIVDAVHGLPIDNEHDLDEIYGMLGKIRTRTIRSPFQLLDELCRLSPGDTVRCTRLDGEDTDRPLKLEDKDCRIGECPAFIFSDAAGQTVEVNGEQVMECGCNFEIPVPEIRPAGQLRYVNDTFPHGIPVRLEVLCYDSPENLYVGLLSPGDDNGTSWETFTDVTVNMRPLPPYYAYIKEYSENEGMGGFLTGNGIACRSHVIPDIRSGFATMHAYLFDRERRAGLAPETFPEYEKYLDNG